jgi:hypothetical protein
MVGFAFDGASNIGVVTVRISGQPPDDQHPYGHGLRRGALCHRAPGSWRLGQSPGFSIHLRIGALLGATVQAVTGLWELLEGQRLKVKAGGRPPFTGASVSAAVLIGWSWSG